MKKASKTSNTPKDDEKLKAALVALSAIEKIAKNFSYEIFDYVGQKKLDKIVKLNEEESDPQICHSHDFMDSNMAMEEAMKRAGFDSEKYLAVDNNDDFFAVWNKAWTIAKENKFWHTEMAEIKAEREEGKLSRGGGLSSVHDKNVLKACEYAKANSISPLHKTLTKFDVEMNSKFENRKFTKDGIRGAYDKMRSEMLENATIGGIPTKKGDIVIRRNPFPDENPNQLFVVVQEQIEDFDDNHRIDCQALGTKLSFPSINQIEKKDLEVVVPAYKVEDAHAWMLEHENKFTLQAGDQVRNAVGTLLTVSKVVPESKEYLLTTFGQASPSPWGIQKVGELLRRGEWEKVEPEQHGRKLSDGGEILKHAEHMARHFWKKAEKEGKLLYRKAKLAIKHVLRKEEGGALEIDEEIEVDNQPDQENDCFIIDRISRGYDVSCAGKFVDNFPEIDDALTCVADWKEENKWWPTTWFVNERGSTWPINEDGKEIKYAGGGDILGKAGNFFNALKSRSEELYHKGKDKVESELHEKKRNIALEAIESVRSNPKINKKEATALRIAGELVEYEYERGGPLSPMSSFAYPYHDFWKSLASMWNDGEIKHEKGKWINTGKDAKHTKTFINQIVENANSHGDDVSLDAMKNNNHHFDKAERYVAVLDNGGHWTILSKPKYDKTDAELVANAVPVGEVGKVVTLKEAKEHKPVLDENEYLYYNYEQGGGILNASTIGAACLKYGWHPHVIGDSNTYELYNRNEKKAAVVKMKGGKYVIEDVAGNKILSGNANVGEAIEKVLRTYFYATPQSYEDLAKLTIGKGDTVIVNAGRFVDEEAEVVDMGIGGNNYKVKFPDGVEAIVFPAQVKKKAA